MVKVLIAEDHEPSRDLLVTLLEYKGYCVLQAKDGAEALEIARSESPDLVITDILMPVIDGYEFARQLRADRTTAQTRIIFYTATYLQPEAEALAKACGVSQVLAKPAEPEEILRTVQAELGSFPSLSVPLPQEEFDLGHRRLLIDKLATKAKELEEEIEERKRIEQQLLHAQKMECIGRLAGGLAHDFNNCLTAVIGYSEFANEKLPPDHPAVEDIETVIKAAQSAAKLTHQLLAFASKQALQPERVDLNELTLKLQGIIQRLIGEDIVLTVTPAPTPTIVEVDPSQIEQVLFNLAVNARDAMPDGGKLTVTIDSEDLSEEQAHLCGEMAAGKYAKLTVQDTGTGMMADVLQHVFEPFFTTKERGKGTGLGLATCFGIIKQSGGDIRAESELGSGTTFQIHLPRVAAAGAAKTMPTALETPKRGTETVLLAEDDPMIRELAAAALMGQGYTILEAENGIDALQVACRHNGTIDLLVTDSIMPQMGGKQLAQKLMPLYPGIRVLIMSGFMDGEEWESELPATGAVFLPKPFTLTHLRHKVRELLDDGNDTQGDELAA